MSGFFRGKGLRYALAAALLLVAGWAAAKIVTASSRHEMASPSRSAPVPRGEGPVRSRAAAAGTVRPREVGGGRKIVRRRLQGDAGDRRGAAVRDLRALPPLRSPVRRLRGHGAGVGARRRPRRVPAGRGIRPVAGAQGHLPGRLPDQGDHRLGGHRAGKRFPRRRDPLSRRDLRDQPPRHPLGRRRQQDDARGGDRALRESRAREGGGQQRRRPRPRGIPRGSSASASPSRSTFRASRARRRCRARNTSSPAPARASGRCTSPPCTWRWSCRRSPPAARCPGRSSSTGSRTRTGTSSSSPPRRSCATPCGRRRRTRSCR